MNDTVNGRLAQPESLGYPMTSPIHDLIQESHVPLVYLIAQPTVKRDGSTPDLTPLAEFGEVKVLINSGEYPALHPERCLSLIEKRLETFDEEVDYLAWAGGDTLAAVLVGVVLERMEMTSIKWLKFQRGWDGNGNRDLDKSYYREVVVPLFANDTPQSEEERNSYAPDPRD